MQLKKESTPNTPPKQAHKEGKRNRSPKEPVSPKKYLKTEKETSATMDEIEEG